LRDELVVSVGLCSKDLLQDEEIMMSILIFLVFEKKLSIIEEILAIIDADFACTFAQLVEIELTIFAHSGDCTTIGKECYQFAGLFLGFCGQSLGLGRVGGDQLRFDLVLESLAI